MKTILVTTDFSPHSRHSLRYVVELIEHDPGPIRILILNTYNIPMKVGMTSGQIILLNDELKRRSKEGLEIERLAIIKLIKNSKIKIDTSSHIGTLKNVVHQLLDDEKIDLVVMGKDGGRHVESIAAFLRNYECPLLTTYLKE